MRVFAILGGLGSQMVKYAYYLKEKNRDSENIFLDTSFFQGNESWNGYELQRIFGINDPDLVELYTEKELDILKKCQEPYYACALKKMKEIQNGERIFRIDRGLLLEYAPDSYFMKVKNYISFKVRKFNHRVRNMFDKNYEKKYGEYRDLLPKGEYQKQKNIYFDEFSHTSDIYFRNAKEEILKIFTFPAFLDEKNIECMKSMSLEDSVAIHIRRSDHLYDNQYLFESGYYVKAVTFMKKKLEAPYFYVFSDDLKWCKEHLNELGLSENDNIAFVDWNHGQASYCDMQLMTYCKHNILAISIFSWWGYYLCKYDNKIVCAPKGFWDEVEYHF